MSESEGLQGKRRAKLTLVALLLTILCAIATLCGNLRGIIFYPANLEARIRAAETTATAITNDRVLRRAEQIARDTAQDTRLKALEDYRGELRSAIELLVYRANEMKVSLDRMNDKLDQRDRRLADP